MLSLIVAMTENHVIGKDNKLIWHLPQDLKRFRQLTSYHTVIMGRKTFESIGKVLPNRHNVILTRDMNYHVDDENVTIVHDISELKKYITSYEECFVIGGESVYRLLMPYAEKIYLTVIYKDFQGDAYFPNIDKNVWTMVEAETHPKQPEDPFRYQFFTYIRLYSDIKIDS